MVSVSSAVPKMPDGNIDIAQWSQRLVQGHARLQHEPLEEAATWLSGFGDSLLLQSLELAVFRFTSSYTSHRFER